MQLYQNEKLKTFNILCNKKTKTKYQVIRGQKVETNVIKNKHMKACGKKLYIQNKGPQKIKKKLYIQNFKSL